jgi:PAS domain S-box-containing protein
MLIGFIVALSIAFQLMAAFIALRLIKTTGNRFAWILIAVAMILQAFRRTLSLINLLPDDTSLSQTLLYEELVGLLISILMLIGVASIGRFFAAIQTSIIKQKKAEAELLQSNRELRTISKCNRSVIRALDDQSLADDICNAACAMAGYKVACVGLIENDENKTIKTLACLGVENTCFSDKCVARKDIIEKELAETAVNTHKLFISQDIDSSDDSLKDTPWFEIARTQQCRSFIVLPLTEQGKLFGILYLCSTDTNIFTPAEIRMLEEMAGDLAFGISDLRLRKERRKTEIALKQAADEWRTTFDSIDDMICILDNNQQILRVNRRFADVFKTTPQALAGQYCYNVAHGTDGPLSVCPHVKALKTNTTESVEYFEPKLEMQIEETVSPIFNVRGRVVGTIHIMKDITKRKRSEEENILLREKTEISSRMATVGEMAAGIAHEINNPLTSVIGFSELLMSGELPPDIKEPVKIIADGSNRVKEIVKRMLNFARQTKSAKTSTNLNELIDTTLELRNYVLRTANIEVIRQLDPDLPWVTVDSGQIQQVFLNLIVNAEYSMKKAQGQGTLTITSEKRGENVCISFRDNGLGMSPETKKKLFTPFFTTKEPGEGTGLGLSLSHSIILEHGGNIGIESEPGKGANFIITLPIALPEEDTPIEPRATECNTSEANKHARIMVVDDEEAIRTLISIILRKNGHLVDNTGNTEEVLPKIESTKYDVMIMDIHMPGLSGMELYRRITEKHPNLVRKFIFITGDSSDQNTRAFLRRNNISYIAKPFEKTELLHKVEELL